MVYKKSIVKRVPLKKYRKRPINRGPKIMTAVKKYVKRAIHTRAENKTANPVIQSYQSILPMTAVSWGNLITASAVWENVTQGTGSGNRTGNKIIPVYWNFRGAIMYNTSITGAAIVKMFVFKRINQFDSPGTGSFLPTDFFQTGNTSTSPSQNLADIYRKVNTDKYKVYTTRTYKIGQSAASTASSNNDFSAMRMFNINLLKYQKHAIKYNDTSFEPVNSGLYVGFVAASINDASIPANSLKISYDITGHYEDM